MDFPNSLVLGDRGMVGGAIVRALGGAQVADYVDLRNQAVCRAVFRRTNPRYVFQCAGRVGGIITNARRPADFLQDNLEISANILRCAHEFGVKKLLNLGSSCIYPRMANQPIKESELLSGPLEETNRAYAVAKIAAIELCDAYRKQHGCNFISAMPTNLYGPGDNFDLETSHVLPAILRKFMTASSMTVTLGGDGTARREFLYVNDLAKACLVLMEKYNEPGPINIGTGSDVTIAELARTVADIVGFRGTIEWDSDTPNGTPQKLLDVSRISHLGWKPTTCLEDGILETVAWLRSSKNVRGWAHR